MSVSVHHSIKETKLGSLTRSDSPFLSYEFFLSLEESYTIGSSSGWNPLYLQESDQALLYTYAKNHSYGEYIFDWQWANFYEQNGLSYYPKLTSMIPFTSATTSHFLGRSCDSLMDTYEDLYEHNKFSSSHFLFITNEEKDFFKNRDYIIRDSFQYHFTNKSYTDFDDFLGDLKSKKAKQIRKERRFSEDVSFKRYTGEELSVEHARQMYQFYLSTISNKNAIAYLNEEFFLLVFKRMKDSILYVQANQGEEAVAGAFYFYSDKCLYGRYWGGVTDIANLHFELCYYQGIDFCIERNISKFEAGAQGEHKISRGFRPTRTYSAHKLKIPQIHKAIENYIITEREEIDQLLPLLSERLPFKK